MGKHQNIRRINIYSGISTTNMYNMHVIFDILRPGSIQSTSVAPHSHTYVNFHSILRHAFTYGCYSSYFELDVYNVLLP